MAPATASAVLEAIRRKLAEVLGPLAPDEWGTVGDAAAGGTQGAARGQGTRAQGGASTQSTRCIRIIFITPEHVFVVEARSMFRCMYSDDSDKGTSSDSELS